MYDDLACALTGEPGCIDKLILANTESNRTDLPSGPRPYEQYEHGDDDKKR